MQGFEIERNPKMLINRIYPLGSGEGVNKSQYSLGQSRGSVFREQGRN